MLASLGLGGLRRTKVSRGNSQRFWVKKTDPWVSDLFLSKSSESLVKN